MLNKWAAGAAALGAMSMLVGCSKATTAAPSVALPSASHATPTAASATSVDVAKLSGPDLADRAAAALRVAGSAHLVGVGMMFGVKGAHLDLLVTADVGRATITTPAGNAQEVKVGQTSYIKASAAFWTLLRVPAKVGTKLADKWVIMPPGSDNKLLSLSGLADDLQHPATGGKYLAKTSTTTYHGAPVVVLKQEDGSITYISAAGPALPVFAHDASKMSANDMTVSDFGKKVTITAPVGAVDMASAVRS